MTAASVSEREAPGLPASLAQALAERKPGHALPRAFAVDRAIYEMEEALIWRRSWLYAGCSAQVRDPGVFFRVEVGDDALAVVRDDLGVLHALHTSCRHRGMPVCSEPAGVVKRWVCPYHQWSYDLDSSLLGCGGMEEEIDREAYGLHRAAVAEVGGLIFVWVGSDPSPLADAAGALGRALAPQGLERAKVAHAIDYTVSANWKLVWENNRECWHCVVGHPQYVKANFDATPDRPRSSASARARAADHRLVLETAGLPIPDEHAETGLYAFPSPGRWWSANRSPTSPTFVTESLDGRPVAPLMGAYPDWDVGTLRVRTVPNFWCHASADHAVLTRLLPAGPELTRIRVQWLVDGDAVEGRDYDLDHLLPFWQLTSEQDWHLCEQNHRGVRSPAFTPGPYSRSRESNVIAFVDWYLARMAEL